MALDRLGHFFSERFVILAARILCATLNDYRCDHGRATAALLAFSLAFTLRRWFSVDLSGSCGWVSLSARGPELACGASLLVSFDRLCNSFGERSVGLAAPSRELPVAEGDALGAAFVFELYLLFLLGWVLVEPDRLHLRGRERGYESDGE